MYMLTHTDDADLVIQSQKDVKRALEEFDKLFSVKGNKGIKVGEGRICWASTARDGLIQTA